MYYSEDYAKENEDASGMEREKLERARERERERWTEMDRGREREKRQRAKARARCAVRLFSPESTKVPDSLIQPTNLHKGPIDDEKEE